MPAQQLAADEVAVHGLEDADGSEQKQAGCGHRQRIIVDNCDYSCLTIDMFKLDYMVQARGLAKRFPSRVGAVDAVRGVDIDVDAGEIVGFLGPNGAGKTTTLRMLTTLLAPSAGTAVVAGHDLRREPVAVRSRIGYVPQRGSTAPQALVGEELIDQGRLHGLPRRIAEERGQALISQLDLEAHGNGPAGRFRAGNGAVSTSRSG